MAPEHTRQQTTKDLSPLDICVLRDVVRFGVLTNDQAARRYDADLAWATDRLKRLVSGGWLETWEHIFRFTDAFFATDKGAGAARCGLRKSRPPYEHLRHDVAVVDLADYLLGQHPSAEWRSERELGRVLRSAQRVTRGRGFEGNGSGHKPDGLLLLDGRCVAIELEHSDKGDLRYASICRWFALNTRVDAVHWYVDDEKIIARIRRVSQQHGFADDVDFVYAPFPPGVALRSWNRS